MPLDKQQVQRKVQDVFTLAYRVVQRTRNLIGADDQQMKKVRVDS